MEECEWENFSHVSKRSASISQLFLFLFFLLVIQTTFSSLFLYIFLSSKYFIFFPCVLSSSEPYVNSSIELRKADGNNNNNNNNNNKSNSKVIHEHLSFRLFVSTTRFIYKRTRERGRTSNMIGNSQLSLGKKY